MNICSADAQFGQIYDRICGFSSIKDTEICFNVKFNIAVYL